MVSISTGIQEAQLPLRNRASAMHFFVAVIFYRRNDLHVQTSYGFDGVALSRFRIQIVRLSVYDQLFAVVIVFRRAAMVGPRADPLPSLHRRSPAATPALSDDTPRLRG